MLASLQLLLLLLLEMVVVPLLGQFLAIAGGLWAGVGTLGLVSFEEVNESIPALLRRQHHGASAGDAAVAGPCGHVKAHGVEAVGGHKVLGDGHCSVQIEYAVPPPGGHVDGLPRELSALDGALLRGQEGVRVQPPLHRGGQPAPKGKSNVSRARVAVLEEGRGMGEDAASARSKHSANRGGSA